MILSTLAHVLLLSFRDEPSYGTGVLETLIPGESGQCSHSKIQHGGDVPLPVSLHVDKSIPCCSCLPCSCTGTLQRSPTPLHPLSLLRLFCEHDIPSSCVPPSSLDSVQVFLPSVRSCIEFLLFCGFSCRHRGQDNISYE